jgi:hypothetical protein
MGRFSSQFPHSGMDDSWRCVFAFYAHGIHHRLPASRDKNKFRLGAIASASNVPRVWLH